MMQPEQHLVKIKFVKFALYSLRQW